MKTKSEEIKKIEKEIQETENIGLNMALSGFNPYTFAGAKLDKLYKKLEEFKSKLKEK